MSRRADPPMNDKGRQRRALIRAALGTTVAAVGGLPVLNYLAPQIKDSGSRSRGFAKGKPYVVIMGDSVSAGAGAPPYCGPHFRSPRAAGALMAQALGMEWVNMARSGAMLGADVADEMSFDHQITELRQVVADFGPPALVAFSVGANDIGVIPAIVDEVKGGGDSRGARRLDGSLGSVDVLYGWAHGRIAEVVGPPSGTSVGTQMVAVGYPFEALPAKANAGLSASFMAELTDVFGKLRVAQEQEVGRINAAQRSKTGVSSFHYVDIAASFQQSPDRLMNVPSVGSVYMDSVYLLAQNDEGLPSGLYHPNAAGHAEMAKAMMLPVMGLLAATVLQAHVTSRGAGR